MRWGPWCVVCLTGCDFVFGLDHITLDREDAAAGDGNADDDAAPCPTDGHDEDGDGLVRRV